MGQPLVHSQRLGSLVEAFSWTLVRDEQDGDCLSSPLPLLEFFGSSLFMWAGPFGLGCVHPLFYLGLSCFYSIFGPTKMKHCHGFSSLMDSYY